MNIIYSLRSQIRITLLIFLLVLTPLTASAQYEGGIEVEGIPLQGEEMELYTSEYTMPITTDTDSIRHNQPTEIEEGVDVILERLRNRNQPLSHTTAYTSWLPVWLTMPLSTYMADITHIEKPLFSVPNITLQSNPSKQQKILFEEIIEGNKMELQALRWLQNQRPELIQETESDLLAHKIEHVVIAPSEAQITLSEPPKPTVQDPLRGIKKILLPRQYWSFGWNSVLQFSQAYISPNWHKGGNSNFNLYNRQLFKADYKKEQLSWNNELEWRLSVFTSPADTVSRYRVADDLLRLRSNIGWESPLKNLFYTLDAEVRTQFFKMREENKTKILSDLFSPVITTVGGGIKYVYEHKSSTYYGRKVRLEVNFAPIAYDFRWTLNGNMDLTRHGFKKGERIYSAVGSMFRANLDFDITQSFAWRSRLYYNTSYKRIETEWENAFIFALSKYFSTRLNVHLRFDDAVPKTLENPYRIQINQLFSFGIEMNI